MKIPKENLKELTAGVIEKLPVEQKEWDELRSTELDRDIENAVIGNGPPPAPSVVSYRVEWNAIGAVNVFDKVAQQFRGEFRDAFAQMEWSARTVDFEFVSAPIGTSTTDAAELGTERNGAFY